MNDENLILMDMTLYIVKWYEKYAFKIDSQIKICAEDIYFNILLDKHLDIIKDLKTEEAVELIYQILLKWIKITNPQKIPHYILSQEEYREDGIPKWEYHVATPNHEHLPLPIDTETVTIRYFTIKEQNLDQDVVNEIERVKNWIDKAKTHNPILGNKNAH